MADKFTFTVLGRLPGLNEYTAENRAGWFKGARLKAKTERDIALQIPGALKGLRLSGVTVRFAWYEPNLRRDADNVVSAKKFILDAMVSCGVLSGDGRRHVVDVVDDGVFLDKLMPRVEVTIEKVIG